MYSADEAAATEVTQQGYLERPIIVINLVRELRFKKDVLQERITKRLRRVIFHDWITDDTHQLVVRPPDPKNYERARLAIARIVSDVINESKKDELALRRK